jgi:xylose isomerase
MIQIKDGAHADGALAPARADKFSFGLWTVGNSGRDPFGDNTRARLDPNDSVRQLASLGAFGISMHDDDLVPYDASPADRDAIVARFRKTLDENGMIVSMATTNLFGHPVFKDGAFTSNDRSASTSWSWNCSWARANL